MIQITTLILQLTMMMKMRVAVHKMSMKVISSMMTKKKTPNKAQMHRLNFTHLKRNTTQNLT